MTTTVVNPAAAVAGMTAADRLMIDTNVWVFATSPSAPDHALAVATLTAVQAIGVQVWSSRQVMREYLSAMTKKKPYAGAVPMAEAATNLSQFVRRCQTAEDGRDVTDELLALLTAVPCGGKQVHDANIVATMRVHGVPNLLTHNVADFVRWAGHITVVPLVP